MDLGRPEFPVLGIAWFALMEQPPPQYPRLVDSVLAAVAELALLCLSQLLTEHWLSPYSYAVGLLGAPPRKAGRFV